MRFLCARKVRPSRQVETLLLSCYCHSLALIHGVCRSTTAVSLSLKTNRHQLKETSWYYYNYFAALMPETDIEAGYTK